MKTYQEVLKATITRIQRSLSQEVPTINGQSLGKLFITSDQLLTVMSPESVRKLIQALGLQISDSGAVKH